MTFPSTPLVKTGEGNCDCEAVLSRFCGDFSVGLEGLTGVKTSKEMTNNG